MSRGRPRDPEKQARTRKALLDAARRLLTEKPYRAITIRELGEQADTQSAMVRYYFGNKEGLFVALLEEATTERRELLNETIDQIRRSPEDILDHVLPRMLEMILNEPWLVRLMQDEVLRSDSALRAPFMKALPARLGFPLPVIFAELQRRGVIRNDADPRYAAASFMSLLMFPVLAEPVLEQALGINREVIGTEAWKRHLLTMFKSGLFARLE